MDRDDETSLDAFKAVSDMSFQLLITDSSTELQFQDLRVDQATTRHGCDKL